MRRTVKEILQILANQWDACSISTGTKARREELEHTVDQLRQMYGEWVNDEWYKAQKRASE